MDKDYARWCDLVRQQGWNEESQIVHLEGFLRQDPGLFAAFVAYAERAAAEENEG